VIDPAAIRYRSPDRQARLRLLAELPQLSPLVAELLVGRGHRDPAAVRRFLSPSIESLHDPFELRGMRDAVELLRLSMQEGLRILIHGDYDCDGICATALLMDGLSELGADVDYHVPDRFMEGYGLSMKAVERCREEGFGVLLSVDCGSSSQREIAAAMAEGLRVIITDHHQVPSPPPSPHALVNPQHPECGYPFKGLCGTGVAFKLLQALRDERGEQPAHLLDLVALATIADVVPLVEENRILVQHGLRALAGTNRPGLKALLEAAGREADGPVDAFTVGFTLAPRLNASGRLEHAKAGVELLRCGCPERARDQAGKLHVLNEERKECEQRIGREIEERLAAEPWRYQRGAIVEWGLGWHEGVIGITAGRLAEKYGLPALVIAVDGERAKGSGRSPENVDLFLALQECGELFSKFGGHPRAGGFSLPSARLDELRGAFTTAANKLRSGPCPVWIDASLGLSQVSFGLVNGLQRLEPYGEANPKPVFLLEGVTVVGQRTVGRNNDHLQLELEQGGLRQRAIAFRQGAEIDALDIQNTRYDLLCQVGVEQFRGDPQLRLQVTGIVRPSGGESDLKANVVDRRNSRARRSELEHWLSVDPRFAAVCRDTPKAEQVYPHLRGRFWTYAGLSEAWAGLVLLTPPSTEEEFCRVMEACRPARLVVLFGRQELAELERAVEARLWGRRHALAVWQTLGAQRAGQLARTEAVERLGRGLRLSPEVVEEILSAFLETGALRQPSEHTSSLVLGKGSGLKLEQTRAFRAVLERRNSQQRLMELFSGPALSQTLCARFAWLREAENGARGELAGLC
jgi:single-stranded-DNA-specific exonuclease